MARAQRWLHLGLGLALVVAYGVVVSVAYADREFKPRFKDNVNGDITLIGNTLMTCPAGGRPSPVTTQTCEGAQDGVPETPSLNNNNWNMTYVDEDGDPTTTINSSSATLTLPQSASVLFAGLYYGGVSTAASRNLVKFKVPGASSYATLTADQLDTNVSGGVTRYQGFVDVTSRVEAAGSGQYWVGDVQAVTGLDRYAGWGLVVAYRAPGQPARNLTIFDGFTAVTQGTSTVAINVSGFQTPPSPAPVRTKLGVVAYEGDRGSKGPSLTLNTSVLSDDTNPEDNFFNSTISIDGVDFIDKTPDYDNQLGLDVVRVVADDKLPNSATDATVTFKTNSDQYFPGVLSFATELFAPSIQATKTVTDLNGGPAARGDTLRYTVTFTNSGQDGADNFVASDLIPVGTVYAPNSLEILTGPNAGAKSDAVGDDQAEFSANLNSVVFRLGQGASGAAGGRITAAGGPASSTSFRFDVTINDGLAVRTPIVNQAEASFVGQSLGTALTSRSNEVTTHVDAPDLTITKTHTGGFVGGAPTPFTIIVSNTGTIPTAGTVTLDDVFPPEAFTLISVDVIGSGWSCPVTGTTTLHCERGDPLAPGASYPPLVVNAVVVNPPPAQIENTAVVGGGGDSDPANNQSTDIGPGTSVADLAVRKSVSESAVPSGGEVTFTVTVHNAGPSAATGVTLTDTLPAATYSSASANSTQGSCTAEVVCTIGSMAPGATVTITIVATVNANDTALTNTAAVTSSTPDPVSADNSASADFVVQKTTDLVLTKAVTQSPNAGQTDGGTYTITVRNAGPLQATNVSVADTIPVDFTPSSVTAPGFACNLPSAGEQLSCSLPTIAPGEELTITVVGTFSVASAGTVVANGAQVTSDEADFNPDDNAAGAETIPIPSADLDLQKTASASFVLPGETVVFSFTLFNAGPSPAADVTVTDTLPPELTFVSSPDCTAAGNVASCAVGALDPGATRSLTLTAQASVSAAGQTVTNTATATSATPDPRSSNNSAVAQFLVQNATDLQLTKTVTSNPIAGVLDGGTYTLTARNAGPIPSATNVSVVDEIPAEFTPSSVTAPGFTCNLPGAGGTLTCTRPTLTIADGEVAISVSGTFDATSAGTTVFNGATVQGDQDDPVSANNEAAASTMPVSAPPPPPAPPLPPPPPLSPPRVDVAVDVRGPTRVVREGGIAAFRLNVTNHGPNTATSVVLTGTAARAVSDSFAGLLQTCTGLPLHCEVGTLAPGAQRSFTVAVRRLRLGLVSVTGNVTAAETETTLANNVDRASVRIRMGRAVVRFTKRADAATARSGDRVGFTMAIRNTGSIPARGVVVCDRLPSGLTWERLGGARLLDGRACWTLRRLGPGATARYRITTRASRVNGVQPVMNTAIVQGANVARRAAGARVTLRPSASRRPPFTG